MERPVRSYPHKRSAVNVCVNNMVKSIKCDHPCSEGYEVGNLISNNFLERSKGFLVERFIKPPVTLTFEFTCEIDLKYIVVQCNVGAQKSSGIELSIQPYSSEKQYESVCSGVLQGNEKGFVFHRYSENVRAKFGVGSSLYDKHGQVLKASKVIVHPKYTGYGWDYDIAVVKTDKPIKLGKKVKAIKLGTETPQAKTKALTAGWGYDSSSEVPEHLLEAQVTVYSWTQCGETYGYHLTKRLLCTFDQNVAPCTYDYGDPLVVNGVLYGLYAGGYQCLPGSYPVLYTDVSSLYQWVLNTTNSEKGA